MPTVSEVTAQAASGLTHIDALLDQGPGWNWVTPGRNTLYYTFALNAGNASDIGTQLAAAPVAFNAAQQAATLQALNRLSQITGISFVAIDDGAAADIHFGAANIISANTTGFCSSAWSYSSSGGTVTSYTADAYVYLDNAEFAATNGTPTAGGQGYEVLLHELGHAFGLKHPFEGSVQLPPASDNTQNTLMSYTHVGGPYSDYSPYDIATLMWLYGGDGLGGALGYSTSGRYLVGTAGADTLGGSNGSDVFEGKAGNDILNGGNGSDTAVYGGLRSAYTISSGAGTVTVAGPDGSDTLSGIESLRFSDQTVAVGTVTNQPPTGSIFVNGSVQQGTTLTVSSTLADADGLGLFSYRWQSSPDGNAWTDLTGATSATFVPAQAHVGARLRVAVSYTDGQGNAESAVSAATVAVANVNDAPVGSVTVLGGANVGGVVSANIALSDLDGIGAYTYRWQSSPNTVTWTDIAGATSPGYSPASADIGLHLRVVVNYVDGFGTAESVPSTPSAAVGGPNTPPSGTLSITGTAQQGQTIGLLNSLQDADGMGTISYRWQSTPTGTPSWTDIPSATGTTLTLDQSLVSRLLRVVASYTDGKGAAESVTSAATSVVQNLNDPPTGSVAILGTVTIGGLLTISQSLADLDGLGSMSFRWQSSPDGSTWTDIPNATALRFSPGDAQSTLRLRAVVSYVDDYGSAESVASAPTIPVGNVNSAPIGTLTITGEVKENQELQAQNSVFDADGMGSFNYRWQSSSDGATWADILSATSDRFTPTQPQVGQLLRVVVSYIDGKGVFESVASTPTTPVINVNAAPTGALTIVGTARQGQLLRLQSTLGDADGVGALNYRWQSSGDGSNWTDIAGAHAATFTASQAQVGLKLRVQASYVDGGGNAETVTSTATALVQNINDAPTGELTVEGIPTRGLPLTVRSTVADADGLGSFSYQWQVASGFLTWVDISGATAASFTPTLAQVGQLVRVQVSYVDGQGTTETVASGAAPAVLPGNTPPSGQVSVSGTVRQGSPVSVVSTLIDPDGLGALSYAWQQSADGNTWLVIDGASNASFTPGQAQVGQVLRVVASYVDGKGVAESVTSAASTAVLGVQRGTAGKDTLTGSSYADEISGLQGNDRVTGGAGNDVIVGGEGIDTAVYLGTRANYQVGPGGSSVMALAGNEGNDTLLQVERVAFSDVSLAFDLDGQAGLVARLLGALFGKAAVANTAYAGIGLAVLDAGSSSNELVQLALNARLGANFSSTDEINLLYQNLAGISPSAADLAFWLGALSSGQYTQVSLALMAANLDLNAQNIDLVGLTSSGLPFSG